MEYYKDPELLEKARRVFGLDLKPANEVKQQEQSLPQAALGATANQDQQLTGYKPYLRVNWDKVAEVFKSPKATAAFYKLALDMLSKIISSNLEKERLAMGWEDVGLRKFLAESQARQRDITPLTAYYKTLGELATGLLERYQTAQDPAAKAELFKQLLHINNTMQLLNKQILNTVGIPDPATVMQQQKSLVQERRPAPKTSVIPREYVFGAVPEDTTRWQFGLP